MFKQSFLYDTLKMDTEVMASQFTTSSGINIKLVKRGVLEVTPADMTADTKSIVISAGVHGNETSPLELVDEIVSAILSGHLEIKERCLFILAHPKAVNNKTRFLDENLNRLFSETAQAETLEMDIAKELMVDVSEFFASVDEALRWHLDLHCAIRRSKHFTFAVSPCTSKKTRSQELFSFVEKARLGAVLLSNGVTNTFSCYSANYHGAKSLTVELGQVSPLGENDLSLIGDFYRALNALLKRQLDQMNAGSVVMYRVCQSLQRTQEDFDFSFSDDVENFTRFKRGEILGRDGEQSLVVKEECEAVVFPNKKVALGSRAALMVTEVAVRYQEGQLTFSE